MSYMKIIKWSVQWRSKYGVVYVKRWIQEESDVEERGWSGKDQSKEEKETKGGHEKRKSKTFSDKWCSSQSDDVLIEGISEE